MKRLVAYTMLFLFSGHLFAQDYPHDIKQYDFIDYEQNKLQYIIDSSSFENLFNKFDKLIFEGKGQINIVHFGGSHIQADMWSGRLREKFQRFSPGIRGGRGFIFPFKMAKTNNPYFYYPQFTGEWEGCRNVQTRKNCDLGLSGISVTTIDSLSSIRISFRGRTYKGYDFNRVKVFHSMDAANFQITLDTEDSLLLAGLIINDEIGYTEFRFSKHIDTLDLLVTQTDTGQADFTLYGITLENDDAGFIYHAIGVNGASTASYLRCKMFQQHLSTIKPDLVVFSIGINDAYEKDFNPTIYEHNYDTLIGWVKQASPDCAILLTTNNDSYYKRRYPNKNAEQVRDVMKNLALTHRCAIWDMYGIMGGLNSIATWQQYGLAKKDKIHFTKDGYHLVADLMFSALIRSYDFHLASKFPN